MKLENLNEFKSMLLNEEKSTISIEKYLRDVKAFFTWAGEAELSKELMLQWRKAMCDQNYSARSVNSMLASIHAYLRFIGRNDCRIRQLKLQKRAYADPEQELTWAEYLRLLKAAEKKPRLYTLLQTICSSGIRVSELRYFTVSAVKKGIITVNCKRKFRDIMIQRDLRKLLLDYAKKQGIVAGPIFLTRSGKPLNRSNIWAEMKKLCAIAHVSPRKVYPHNLRKLFARKHYKETRDLAKLADMLGHSSVDTTRIYIIDSGKEHLRQLERLKLVVEPSRDIPAA